MKFLLLGGIVVVGIQLSSGGESEGLSFHLWQSWWETQQFNLLSSVTPPPLQLEKCQAWKKRQKTLFWEGERHRSCLGSPWWGLACQVWDLTVSPLCPSVYHLLSLLEGLNSFAKHKAVKLQKLNPCNEILLPPFSQSCQNNDVFMVFYLMCEISSSQIWIKAFCAIYPLKRILSRFLLIDRNYNFRRWVVKLLFTLEWTAQGDKGSAWEAQQAKMFYVLLHHSHSTSCLI